MTQSMAKVPLCRVCLAFYIFLNISFLSAAKSTQNLNRFEIEHGGHWFYTNYKLYIPQAVSALPVEMVAGSNGTDFTKVVGLGAVRPRPFSVWWNFKVNNIKQTIGIYPATDKDKIKNLEQSIQPAWQSLFQLLATKVAPPYFQIDRKEKPQQLLEKFTLISPTFRIKPLRMCRMETLDNLYGSVSPRTVLERGALIRVSTQLLRDKKGKKRLTSVVVFRTRRDGPESSITFVQTKNGLKEVARKRMQGFSPWLRCLKKAVNENLKKYRAFEKIHANFVKAYAQQKAQINEKI